MEELIKSLPKILRTVDGSPELNEAAVIAAWRYVAGDGLRNQTQATKLNGNTLQVAVRDIIWQQQMASMKSQLIFRINSILGAPLLQNIEWRVDPKALSSLPPEKTDTSAEILDNEVPFDLWSAASCIEDKQLRQKFLRAALATLKKK